MTGLQARAPLGDRLAHARAAARPSQPACSPRLPASGPRRHLSVEARVREGPGALTLAAGRTYLRRHDMTM